VPLSSRRWQLAQSSFHALQTFAFQVTLTLALAQMSVTPSTIHYFDSPNSLCHTASSHIQRHSSSTKPVTMLSKLKKTFSTRKSSKATNDHHPQNTAGAGQMLGNAPLTAPVSKRSSGSRDSGLTPSSHATPFASASPATRRPSKYQKAHIQCTLPLLFLTLIFC
jgi:hypothetical protein